MGEAFLTRRGGGASVDGGVKGAVIGVTFPEGATVSVSNGTKTYTSKDTDGNTAFSVEAGTWTVTAALGEDSDSKEVTVEEGNFVTVEIIFVTYIFKEGSGTLLEMQTNSQATIEDSYISMLQSGGGAAGKAYASSKVDLTNINTLWADGLFSEGQTGNYRTGMFVHSSILNDNAGPHEGTAWTYFETDGERKIISLDVSNLTGAYYIGFHGKSAGQIYNFYYK